MNLSILKDYGINVEKGVARCLNDSEMYVTILGLFLKDDTMARGRAALDRRDYVELFKCMHELKGSSGNVDLTDLFNAVCELVELLRTGSEEYGEISRLFDKAEVTYSRTKEGIRLATAE